MYSVFRFPDFVRFRYDKLFQISDFFEETIIVFFHCSQSCQMRLFELFSTTVMQHKYSAKAFV